MSTHIGITYSAIAGTAAGLGRAGGGKTVIADRPEGAAGGMGLGLDGGELLSAALGGCFWNDLHYVAAASGVPVQVQAVEAEIELAGNPPRVVRAHVRARLAGNEDRMLQAVFDEATRASTVAGSLTGAFPIVFDRLAAGDGA